ncbi:lipopolysaccharide biosynthesis protein [Glaciibacter superstes]|uniref:lipopolysaccharide biosynthesis protein n=1 Tax=Glaciibacter superstes TaxID=501023 RepID=UPI0003B70B25|nr:hypothetical protein [Glaciibacter superstes]
MNIAIGRIAGSAVLGLTQSILASASIAALLNPAGSVASRYLASERSRGGDSAARATATYLARRTVVIATVLAISTALVVLLSSHVPLSTAIVTGLMVLAVTGRGFIEGLHFGGGETTRLAQWSLIVAALGTVGTLAVVLSGVRSAWVLGPLALGSLVFVTMSWPRRAGRMKDSPLKREIRIFMLLATFGTLASNGFSQSAVLVATTVNGLDYAGKYAAAFTLVTPLFLVTTAMGSILFPALAAAHSSGSTERVRAVLRRATSALTTAVVGAFILVAVASGALVAVLWGDAFSLSRVIILVLLPGIVASAIAVPAVNSITSSSNRGMMVSVISSAVGALVGVLTWLLVIPVYPEIGVPLGFSVGTIVIALIPYLIAWKRYGMRWTGETLTVVSAVTVTLCVSTVLQLHEVSGVYSALIAISLLALWCLVRRTSVRELFEAVRGVIGRRHDGE